MKTLPKKTHRLDLTEMWITFFFFLIPTSFYFFTRRGKMKMRIKLTKVTLIMIMMHEASVNPSHASHASF